MRPNLSLIYLVLLTLICPQVMGAIGGTGLTFVSDRVSVTVKPDAKKVSLPFDFENKTKRTIKIASYDSACSCISARIQKGKMSYEPGEKGKIVVDFALGSFSGLQEKTLMLWTTDDTPEKPSSILTSVITIPLLFEISPTTLFWDQHGDGKPQSLTIKVHNDKPIKILKDSGTNKNFPYEIKTIRDGWEYEIVVTPQSVDTPGMGMIKLTTDSPIARYQRQQAFVCVKRGKK